ncbi:MAG: RNA pseudouridine synthase [Lachnospiraceae bacterium]|nr:RNA pseudouridine synthase [Lachnospiraceae bacterium]
MKLQMRKKGYGISMRKNQPKPEILYIDDSVIVCIKPQGMPVQNDKSRDLSVLNYLKNEIVKKEKMKTEPEVYVVHRLDRPVGGVMVFGRTKDAAASLTKQMQDGTFDKYYQVVLTGFLPNEEGCLTDYLLKDGKTNCSKVVKEETKGAKKAVLEYEVLDILETDQGDYTYALIHLITGRHHQIRVQFANRNAGIWGDTKYNPKFQKVKRKYHQIGLYSTRISFVHPVKGNKLVFKTEPEGEAFEILDAEEF